MKVPQFMPWVGQEEYAALQSCFDANWLTEGPKTRELSERLLALTGARFGVFAPNGTLALYLGLRALGVGRGDEVIVPDFTFVGSATAVEMTGATPVFCDVDRRHYQIDLAAARRRVGARTKAVMPVHIYGTAARMDEVMEFARAGGLAVIEDAAQAVGVHYRGRHAGTFGDVGTFSFFADKTLTTGEGGYVLTNDEAVYDRLRYLRNQGRIERGSFVHPEIGYNFRITDLQAAIGLVQLAKLPAIIERKNAIRARYHARLSGLPGVELFQGEREADWIPFRIGLTSERAAPLMEHLGARDIETRTYFYPLHKQPCFRYLADAGIDLDDASFPNALHGYQCGVCLPSYPTIAGEQIDHVCAAVEEFFGR